MYAACLRRAAQHCVTSEPPVGRRQIICALVDSQLEAGRRDEEDGGHVQRSCGMCQTAVDCLQFRLLGES